MKKYLSETESPKRRGRPLGRWKDGVGKYMHKIGTDREEWLEQAKRECLDRERWRFIEGVKHQTRQIVRY